MAGNPRVSDWDVSFITHQLCRKKLPAKGGVVELRDEGLRARLMAITPVDEIWGIGWRLSAKLEAQGIKTVADLVAAGPKALQRRYGVVAERTVQELRGIPCVELEQEAHVKLQIICSRSCLGGASPRSAPCIRLCGLHGAGRRKAAGGGDVLSPCHLVHSHQPVPRPGALLLQSGEHQAGHAHQRYLGLAGPDPRAAPPYLAR